MILKKMTVSPMTQIAIILVTIPVLIPEIILVAPLVAIPVAVMLVILVATPVAARVATLAAIPMAVILVAAMPVVTHNNHFAYLNIDNSKNRRVDIHSPFLFETSAFYIDYPGSILRLHRFLHHFQGLQ